MLLLIALSTFIIMHSDRCKPRHGLCFGSQFVEVLVGAITAQKESILSINSSRGPFAEVHVAVFVLSIEGSTENIVAQV